MDTKGLIDKVTGSIEIERGEAAEMLETLTGLISEQCAEGDSVAIPGFGTFETRKKNERVAVHPSTGKRILVPPKLTMTFKPSALLKQKIKKG